MEPLPNVSWLRRTLRRLMMLDPGYRKATFLEQKLERECVEIKALIAAARPADRTDELKAAIAAAKPTDRTDELKSTIEVVRQEQGADIRKTRSRVDMLVMDFIRRQAPREVDPLRAGIAAMLQLPESTSLPVVFITDSNYVVPTCVAITSLLRHRAPRTRYAITVIGVDLSDKDVARFAVFGSAVTVLRPKNVFRDFQTTHPYVSKAALFKFNLARLLPACERVLYLDSDVLVLKDLASLFDCSFGDNLVAAVLDYAGMEQQGCHARLGQDAYFNSGVMLLNLEGFRRENMEERLLDAKREMDKRFPSRFMDQDAFNYALNRRLVSLPPEYNMMYTNNQDRALGMRTPAEFYGPSLVAYAMQEDRPSILHLTHILKPWKTSVADKFEHYQYDNAIYCALSSASMELINQKEPRKCV